MVSAKTLYAIALTILSLAAFLLLRPTGLVKWLQKKNYQYEVTFALYMLTPTEKFIFNSILFLTVSMLLIATTLYLPNHMIAMTRRAYYYCAGDGPSKPIEAATGWATTAYQAVINKTASAAATAAEV